MSIELIDAEKQAVATLLENQHIKAVFTYSDSACGQTMENIGGQFILQPTFSERQALLDLKAAIDSRLIACIARGQADHAVQQHMKSEHGEK